MIKTIKEARAKGFEVYIYDNGDWADWAYEDENGNLHLFRNGKELTEGIVAKWVYSYSNGEWEYKDEDGNWHLFQDGVELTKGIVAKQVHSYSNGIWEYEDEDGNKIKKKGI